MANPSVFFFLLISFMVHHFGASNAQQFHVNFKTIATRKVGEGQLLGPEDVTYESETDYLYTGCSDGWIKRFKAGDGEKATVENWVFVDGRPIGLAFGPGGRLYVANAFKGLMVVEADKTVKVLSVEAKGVKFLLPNGVDVAEDGVVYFTDSSYKYNLTNFQKDIDEGQPHGRFLSYDPATGLTKVLVRDIYFANGVAVSPTQDFVIYCETPQKRCRKYNLKGANEGRVENFPKTLPGLPDNIRYDGKSSYWIALYVEKNCTSSGSAFKYSTRKTLGINEDRVISQCADKGLLRVSTDGKQVSFYTNPNMTPVSGGIKVGNHIYLSHLVDSFISLADVDA